jgi:glyceraldehyde-3-phosphate dehydrogenase/erythrose-4-phosphate dehydrogenase
MTRNVEVATNGFGDFGRSATAWWILDEGLAIVVVVRDWNLEGTYMGIDD